MKNNRIKHRKIRWNRVVMLLVVLVFCFSFAVNAFGDVNQENEYIDVTVTAGDSLWNLIREYNPDYDGDMNQAIYRVQCINSLDSACLYSGQVIQIPIDL